MRVAPRSRRRARGRGRRRGPTLLDVAFLCVPPTVLTLLLLAGAALDHLRLSRFDDWWTIRSPDVASFVGHRLRLARHAWRAALLENRLTAPDERHAAVHLRVDPTTWKAITSDVPGHWGEWIDASLERGGDLQPVELRLRGDASAHWTTAKQSLSIKTERGELAFGLRRLNLTAKGVLPQVVSGVLAQEMGLLSPPTAVVPVYLNGRFHGLYRALGRPDELFLRHAGRMPGNVFRGDALLRGDACADLPDELFQNPWIWERTARNDRPGAIGTRALEEWIAALNGSTFDEHRRFLAWHERDELARLLALMLMCGDPHHMSGQHNQYWYEDPASGRMHPVVWDLLIRPLDVPLFDSVIHRFWLSALRDPQLFDATLQVIDEWNSDDRFFRLARRLAEDIEEQHADALLHDRLLGGVIPPPGSAAAVLGTIRHNLEMVLGWTRDAEVAFHAEQTPRAPVVLDLLASGRAGSLLEGLALDGEGLADARLWADRNQNGVLDPGDMRLEAALEAHGEGTRLALAHPEPLLPGCTASGADLVPEPLHYRFFLDALDAAGEPLPLASIRPELRARFGAAALHPRPWAAGERVPSARSWHPWLALDEAPPESHVWSGEVHLRRDLVVEEGASLVIEPGTRIRLDPDVSVLARGRVLARGERERPISIEASGAGRPWGAFALQGSGADGSRFEHVRFEGGGGALLERVEYKGAVSVHGARDVVFDACTFAANLRCDDLLNAVGAEVDVLDCVFEDANGDGIDFDLSSGDIARCRIARCRNDGIDLMSCDPRIVSTTITDCGDKGISIGEGSAPWILGCAISGCARGIEVKDGSRPVVLDSRVTANVVGLLQQQKSPYYASSGRAVLASSLLADNGTDYEGLDGARLIRCGARIGAELDDGDAHWLRCLAGVDLLAGLGRPRSWELAGPARVVASGTFREGLGDPSAGWRRSGAVSRLAVRGQELVLELGGPGLVATAVDWQLPADGSRYWLLLEAWSEGLEGAQVVAGRQGLEARAPLALSPAPGIGLATSLELAPGSYEALALCVPARAGGRLELAGWRVLALDQR